MTNREMLAQARYLQSIACLVKDAEKQDELQQNAQELLARAQQLMKILAP